MSWFNSDVKPVPIPAEFGPSDKARLAYYKDRNASMCEYNWLRWVVGIYITTVSLSLGAPFWFELLVRLINIRRSGPKPMTTEQRSAK